jgi:hypothetical protein
MVIYAHADSGHAAAGTVQGWKFPKFHAIRHIPRLILMFGCLEVSKHV